MPWTNDGKDGGSWKPDNPGPWGHPPQSPASNDFENWLRRAQTALRSWLPGGGLGGRTLGVLGLLGVLLWLLTGFYTIGPNEVGLNLIFGRYTGKTTSGLNYNLPYPIGSVEKLAVTDRNTTDIGFISRTDDRTGEQATFDLPEESLMLTDDQNIADVKFVVIWQIDPSHPEDYAFNIDDPDDTVKAVAESAMRAVIGRSLIQNILTADRKVIEPAVQDLAQKILDKYKAGVLVLQVQLQSVDPPQEVITAFRDVTAAQQDRDRMRNEAQTYANKIVPAAQGDAAAIRQQAEGYKLQTIDEATGQASRFSQVEAQYKTAPALTRERIYLETMEKVLGGSDKVVVDTGNGQSVMPYLPLPLPTPNNSSDGAPR
jgi:modulator of FtsH protease HflK